MRTPPPPAAPSSARQPHSHPLRTLTVLTLAVLLAHWALLSGAPLAVALHSSPDAAAPLTFTTRTLAQPVPEPLRAPPPKPRAAPPRRQGPAPIAPEATPPSSTPTAVSDPGPDLAPESPAAQPLATTEAEPARPPGTGPAQEITLFHYPAPVRLKYKVKGEIKGIPYFANGELLWSQNSETYKTRLEISHFLLGSRVQTSVGALSPQGLEPQRFGDKVRSEVAAHFDHYNHKVTFSANTPDVALLPGAQDQLSVFMQIAAMLASVPTPFPAGTLLPFQAIGPRTSESWTFTVGTVEELDLPGGAVSALRLWRDPTGEYDPKVEIWMAPNMEYLPVRIRLTRGRDDFIEQQWNATEKPP